jgi:hypothetical protein
MKILVVLTAALMAIPSAWAHEGQSPDQHLVFEANGVHAHVYWETLPTESEPAVARVEFRKAADHTPAEITAEFGAELFMPEMGHGSAPVDIAPVLDEGGTARAGVYRITNMYFFMAGTWEVILSLKAADGSVESAKFEYVMGGDDHGGHDRGAHH